MQFSRYCGTWNCKWRNTKLIFCFIMYVIILVFIINRDVCCFTKQPWHIHRKATATVLALLASRYKGIMNGNPSHALRARWEKSARGAYLPG